ncbi:MAG TPA: SIMPL domain-containing protein, partial [Firmicutes bacterium]|nr:SIMPL domain-containing protein [Bacillota bacterium]
MQRRKVAILGGLALLLVAMAPGAAATPEGVPEGTAVPAPTQEAYTGGNLTAFSAGGTVLTVYGGGSAATVPDQVEIRLGVGGGGSSPGAAEDAVEQLAARIRQQLNAKGVKYSLTRSFFTVWPAGGAGEKAPRFEGSSDYRLVLSEPAQVDTALAAVSAAGAVRIH